MQKINFKDRPSKDTPINATNLNTLQDNVEDAIDVSSAKNIVQANFGTRAVTPDSENNTISSHLIVGDKLSVSNNKIKIGANVSKVKCSMNASVQSPDQSPSTVSIAIIKNGLDLGTAYSYHSSLGMYYYATCVISDLIIEVEEGDEISFKINVDKSYTLHDDQYGVSKLIVEVIE